MAACFLVGAISLGALHSRFAGPTLEDDPEEAILREMMGDSAFNPTWIERVTMLCIIVGVMLLFIRLLR